MPDMRRAGFARSARRAQGAGGGAQVVVLPPHELCRWPTVVRLRERHLRPAPCSLCPATIHRLPINVPRCEMRRVAAVILLLSATSLYGQWTFGTRIELRANYRDSKEAKRALAFPFPPSFLPVGQTTGFLETVNAGRHTELSVAQIRLDADYGNWFAAHAQLHGQDKYRCNPTSEDRKTDADELRLRGGQKPESLAQLPAQDTPGRNRTSEERRTDADGLWLRVGQKPESLARPEKPSGRSRN